MSLRTLFSQARRTADTVPLMGCLPPFLAFTRGNHIHVDPVDGHDEGGNGSLYKPVKTLARAQFLATANQNDIVFFHGRGNSSSLCTDYQTATLDWAKDLVHLIAVNSGIIVSPRSRIALVSTYATASNLFTLSAKGCYISGFQFYEGVADANPTGCVNVTGNRNMFERCHLAGIGGTANDIAGAYSLKLDGAEENLFKNCTIGLDTVARGSAANSGLLVDSAATRNQFEDCFFTAFLEHATNHVHVRLADATAIDRYLRFKNCHFNYESTNYGAAGTGVMKLTATLTQGRIELINCTAESDAPGTTIKWDVDDRNDIVVFGSPTPAADTCNVGRWV